jgi:hypothetical protein
MLSTILFRVSCLPVSLSLSKIYLLFCMGVKLGLLRYGRTWFRLTENRVLRIFGHKQEGVSVGRLEKTA